MSGFHAFSTVTDMPQAVDWDRVRTVFLDMDGTLLDLHFDNHFWIEAVPARWGELRGLAPEQAKQTLHPRFKAVEGTLDWYCLDHWARELELDILELKHELAHMIRVLPHVHDFLHFVRGSGRRLVLVTNAHGDTLELKMQHTRLNAHFDQVLSSHEFGIPKEGEGFWESLRRVEPFEPADCVFFDDSLPVLRNARRFGIGQVVAMTRPDSRFPPRQIDWDPAIETFREVME